MTPQQIQSEREKFEAPFPAVMLEKEGEDQTYVNTAVYAQWKGWLAHAIACEAESNLATDELAKEAPTPAHMEALYELYEQMSCAGPIDSFTVKEILARIQATDTRPPVDIEKIAKAVKKLREAK